MDKLSGQLEHIYATVMTSGISAVGAQEFNEAIISAQELEQRIEELEDVLDSMALMMAASALDTVEGEAVRAQMLRRIARVADGRQAAPNDR